jgi:hypothetical protein
MEMQPPVGGRRGVTRVEVVDVLEGAFTAGAIGRDDLVAVARRNGARPSVVDLLGRLPDRKFVQPRDLWVVLPDVPID